MSSFLVKFEFFAKTRETLVAQEVVRRNHEKLEKNLLKKPKRLFSGSFFILKG